MHQRDKVWQHLIASSHGPHDGGPKAGGGEEPAGVYAVSSESVHEQPRGSKRVPPLLFLFRAHPTARGEGALVVEEKGEGQAFPQATLSQLVLQG